MSFIKRIEEDITNGKAASEAIASLESVRDGRTLPQLQVALRPKGRKGTTTKATLPVAASAETMPAQ
jgi:hypothetical protein